MSKGNSKYLLRSWNINSDWRVEGALPKGFASKSHEKWQIAYRMPYIKEALTKGNPDICLIQETRQCQNEEGREIDSVKPLYDYLSNNGYEVLVTPLNIVSPSPFQYITAFNHKKFSFINHDIRYFTKTSNSSKELREKGVSDEEIKDHNFGAFYERGVAITILQEKGTENKIAVFNVHLETDKQLRLKSCEKINEFVDEIINQYSNIAILVGGDFNTFPDWGGKEQLGIINDYGKLQHLNDITYFPNGVTAQWGFVKYIYDCQIKTNNNRQLNEKSLLSEDPQTRRKEIKEFYEKNNTPTGGILDNVFGRGLKDISDVVISPITISESDAKQLTDYSSETIKAWTLDHQDFPPFASDHPTLDVHFGLLGQSEDESVS